METRKMGILDASPFGAWAWTNELIEEQIQQSLKVCFTHVYTFK